MESDTKNAVSYEALAHKGEVNEQHEPAPDRTQRIQRAVEADDGACSTFALPAPDAVVEALLEIKRQLGHPTRDDAWVAYITRVIDRALAASRAPKVIAPHDPNCAQWLGGKCDCD